ncbi:MAG: hypothetical protein ACLRRA_09560 [Acutalibacteraceae bacterium]
MSAQAILAARVISSSVASLFPQRRLSKMVPVNNKAFVHSYSGSNVCSSIVLSTVN